MNITVANSTKTEGKISELLCTISKGKVVVSKDKYTEPFADVGVDSVMLLTLIISVEDEFGMEWDDDTPETVFKSINSMGNFLDNLVETL